MSINRMALRLMTVMALRGATDAGNRVWDSRIGEVDALAREEGANPFILVYADDEDGNGGGASLRKPDRRVTLVIEVAIGIVEKSQGGYQLMYPETDAQLELALDVLETQIFDALQHMPSAARDAWAQLVQSIENVRIRRGAWSEADKNNRYAARLIEMQIRIPRDPVPSGKITPLIEPVLQVLEDDQETNEIAQELRALAQRAPGAPGNEMTTLGRAAALIGASSAVADALFVDPELPDDRRFEADPQPVDAQPEQPGGGG